MRSSNPVVPDVLVQYGPPRSASTLQFQILCAATYLLHAKEPERCLCRFGSPSQPAARTQHQRYEVVKTHRFPRPDNISDYAWVFATAVNDSAVGPSGEVDWRETAQHLKIKTRLDFKFVQLTSMLARRGYLIAFEYQRLLGLSDEQLAHILEYLRYWTVLRQCCGREMSRDYRAILQNDSQYVPHHLRSSPLYPACEMYDLNVIESSLLTTYIYRHFASYARRFRSFSAGDGEFNGSYCSHSNRRVAEERHSQSTPWSEKQGNGNSAI